MRGLRASSTVALALVLLRCSSFEGEAPTSTGDAGVESGTVDGPAVTLDGATCGADVSTDPNNCGQCGHDCHGGDCSDGKCQARVVAAGLMSPQTIAVGDTAVVWVGGSSGQRILSCPRSKCGPLGPTVLFDGASAVSVSSFAVSGDHLFFATKDTTSTQNQVEVCELANCSPTRRVVDGPTPSNTLVFSSFKATSQGVFWAEVVTTSGVVKRMASEGTGVPVAVVADTGCNPQLIAVGPSDISWSCVNGARIRRCPLPCSADGGSPLESPSSDPQHLERTGSELVWDTSTDLVVRSEPAGTLTILAPRGQGPIAVREPFLFFQDTLRGQLTTCALPACTSTTVLAKSTIASGLAADDADVYWAVQSDGLLLGLAR